MNFLDNLKSKLKMSSGFLSSLTGKGNFSLVKDSKMASIVEPDELSSSLASLESELSLDELDRVIAGVSDIDVAVESSQVVASAPDLEDTLELFPKDWIFPDKKEAEEIPPVVESHSSDDDFWKELEDLVGRWEKAEQKSELSEPDFGTDFSSKAEDDIIPIDSEITELGKNTNDDKHKESSHFFKKAGDLPDFEPKLSPNLSNSAQASFITPEPVKAGPSFLDQKFVELVGMDIEVVRSAVLAEIKELETADSEYRKVQLQKIFSKLLSYQPMSEYGRNYSEDEQRFYADIISTPGLITEPYVVSFLKNDFYSMHNQDEVKKNLLIKVSDYYATHSQEAIDKFNYVFRSTDYVSTFFLDNPDVPLDRFFSERTMSMFDKEDLSLLYRFYLNSNYYDNLDQLFLPEKDKALFMMSILNKKVKQLTGHSVEFLECAMMLMNSENRSIVPILESFYDKLIFDKSEEKVAGDVILSLDNIAGVKELINFIVESKYNRGRHPLRGFDTYDEFVLEAENIRNRQHAIILGDSGVEKARMNLFKPEDFPKSSSFDYDMRDDFVAAFLENVYGISLKSAQYFATHYGKHLKGLEAGIPPRPEGMSDEEYLASLDESKMAIMKKDLPALQMLKAICSLVELDFSSPDFADKLRVLQTAYLTEMQRKGFDYQNPYASFAIVEGALNNMYMNSYNKLLTSSKDAKGVIRVDDGVELLDAGVEFNMLVTSLGGVSNIFDDSVDMASKWNTASMSRGQGICSTHISAQNMGVIDLSAPILGFANVPEYSLDMMGTSDIWTDITAMNLRRENKASPNKNRFFVPGNMMSDECRYGYNEILIDRFAASGPNGELKLQPEYLIYFKFDEQHENDPYYRMAHKTAKDFGVPIMVVDVPKIKEHERSVIDGMRDELFSNDTVNPDLVHDILTRYMNNYTGSLTFVGKGLVYEDFSVDAMRTFVNDIFNKAVELGETEEAKAWIDALDSVYQEEKRKYDEAIGAGGYKYSVVSFVLEKYDIEGKISRYRSGDIYDPDKTEEITQPLPKVNSGFEEKVLDDSTKVVIIPDEKYDPALKSCIDFITAMEIGSKVTYLSEFNGATGEITHLIDVEEPEDKQLFVIENLVMSYFYENLESPITNDIIWNDCDVDLPFAASNDFDFNASIFESPFKEVVLEGEGDYAFNFEKVDQYVSKIESMSSQEFLHIFTPVIMKKSKETGIPFEDISSRMLDKKDTIREKFELLQKQIDVAKTGGDPMDVIDDSKKV